MRAYTGLKFLAVAAVGAAVIGGVGCKTQHIVEQSMTLGDLRAAGNRAYGNANFEDAAQYYGQYLDIRPHEASVQYKMGETLMELGQPGAAASHYSVAFDLQPGNQDYLEGFARALGQADRRKDALAILSGHAEGEGTAGAYLSLGRFAAEAGLADEAEKALLEAARLSGNRDATPHRELARFYESVGDTRKARERWRVVYWFDNRDAEALRALTGQGEVVGPSLALPPELAGSST